MIKAPIIIIFLILLASVYAFGQSVNGTLMETRNLPSANAAADFSNSTASIIVPFGTTAQRPSSPSTGMLRYNTDAGSLEYYSSVWGSIVPALSTFNNSASHSIVTTAAAANGFQISATRNASVSYSISISTTANIGGTANGYVILEIAATNSSSAGDWQEISRLTNSQTITLAIALQSVQVIAGTLSGIIPSGYYARLRSVSSSGSPTFSFISGQEVY